MRIALGKTLMDIDFGALLDDNGEKPKNPRDIFQMLDKHPDFDFLRSVQTDVLDRWFDRRSSTDTVIKLNVGSGKTVVGLLTLQSCLNEDVYPAVFVCPDKMLVAQVVREAARLGVDVTEDPRNADFRSGRAILVTNIYRLFNGRSVFGVGKAGEKISIGAVIIDDAHACLRTLERQFRLTVDNNHPIYKWSIERFEDALKKQSLSSFYRVKEGDWSEYVEVPFWAMRDHAEGLLDQLIKVEKGDDDLQYVLPFICDALPLCRVVIGGGGMEISATFPWTDLVNAFRQATRRIYMTATLADDTILHTHLGADIQALGTAVTTPSITMGERMILMPQELNPDITLSDLRELLVDLAKDSNVVVIVPSKVAAEDWEDIASQVLFGEDVEVGVERLRAAHVGLTVLVNRYDGIDLPEAACRVLAIVGLPEAASLIERADIAVLKESGVTLRRQIQRIEQGMGRGVRSADDHCAVILFGSALTERLLSAEGKKMLTAATRAQLDLSLRLAKQMGKPSIDGIKSVIAKCLDRDAGWRKSARQILLNAADESELRIDAGQVALRTAIDEARNGDSREAVRTLSEAIDAADDDATRAWMSNRLAHILDFHDRSAAQRVLKTAHSLNRSVTRPQDGIAYEPISRENQAQAATVMKYLGHRTLEAPERIMFANRLVEDLVWKRNSHLPFEAAIKDVGAAIGLLSQRPEHDFDEGPDNLWKLPNGNFIVIECKNGSQAKDGIAKDDLAQLGQALEWFEQKYGPNELVTPLIVHPRSTVGPQASSIPGCRVIDGHRLRLLKDAFVAFVKAVATEDVLRDPVRVHEQLVAHQLTGDQIIDAYTVALE